MFNFIFGPDEYAYAPLCTHVYVYIRELTEGRIGERYR